MLEQNGIEDPYPLDATIEYEDKKILPKPIIATENNVQDKSSFTYEDPDDQRYDSNDMPEYGVETKADFKGNQEAADWLMHDPNKFNIMPDEDTKTLFSDGQDSSKESSDDPIRLDKDHKQDYESYNDDNQEDYAKIGESLAPDSNMDKIYTKYEKYLSQMDQRISGKENHVDTDDKTLIKNEHEDKAGSDDFSDVSEGNDVTTQVGNNENEQIALAQTAGENSNTVSDVSNTDDKVGRQNNEDKIITSKDEDNISKVIESGLNSHQKLDEKIKTNEENQQNKNDEKEASRATNQKENEESGRHDNKPSREMGISLSKPGIAAFDGSKERSQNVLPVYRIINQHRVHKTRPRHSLRAGAPLTELGTSRQYVDVNRYYFKPQVTQALI
jgi:hypothetical protein